MQFHPTTALEEHLDAIENEPIALYKFTTPTKFILIKRMQPDVLRRTHIDDFPASQTVDLSSDKFDDLGIILPCIIQILCSVLKATYASMF